MFASSNVLEFRPSQLAQLSSAQISKDPLNFRDGHPAFMTTEVPLLCGGDDMILDINLVLTVHNLCPFEAKGLHRASLLSVSPSCSVLVKIYSQDPIPNSRASNSRPMICVVSVTPAAVVIGRSQKMGISECGVL